MISVILSKGTGIIASGTRSTVVGAIFDGNKKLFLYKYNA
jgi:hypothetical protein